MGFSALIAPFSTGLTKSVNSIMSGFFKEAEIEAPVAKTLSPREAKALAKFNEDIRGIRQNAMSAFETATKNANEADEKGLLILANAPSLAKRGSSPEKLMVLFHALDHFRREEVQQSNGFVPPEFDDALEQRYGMEIREIRVLLLNELAKTLLSEADRAVFASHLDEILDHDPNDPRLPSGDSAVAAVMRIGTYFTHPDQLAIIPSMTPRDISLFEFLGAAATEVRRESQLENLRLLKRNELETLKSVTAQASLKFRGSIKQGSRVDCWHEACRFIQGALPLAQILADLPENARPDQKQDLIDPWVDKIHMLRKRHGIKVWLGVFGKGLEFADLLVNPDNQTKLDVITDQVVEAFTLMKLQKVLKLQEDTVHEFMRNFDTAIDEWGKKSKERILERLAQTETETDMLFTACVSRWHECFYEKQRIRVIIRMLRGLFEESDARKHQRKQD